MRIPLLCAGMSVFAATFAAHPAISQENYESWPILKPLFESTSGGGIMIGGYDPVVRDGKCFTDFTTSIPGGALSYNSVEFDAVPANGGILCTNGKWRSKDGSATGTTPFRVFIKDGVKRGSQ